MREGLSAFQQAELSATSIAVGVRLFLNKHRLALKLIGALVATASALTAVGILGVRADDLSQADVGSDVCAGDHGSILTCPYDKFGDNEFVSVWHVNGIPVNSQLVFNGMPVTHDNCSEAVENAAALAQLEQPVMGPQEWAVFNVKEADGTVCMVDSLGQAREMPVAEFGQLLGEASTNGAMPIATETLLPPLIEPQADPVIPQDSVPTTLPAETPAAVPPSEFALAVLGTGALVTLGLGAIVGLLNLSLARQGDGKGETKPVVSDSDQVKWEEDQQKIVDAIEGSRHTEASWGKSPSDPNLTGMDWGAKMCAARRKSTWRDWIAEDEARERSDAGIIDATCTDVDPS